MPVKDPLDTPVPYQCQNHQKCKRRLYDKETFNTLKILGTKVIGRDSKKVIGEWVIMTCPIVETLIILLCQLIFIESVHLLP